MPKPKKPAVKSLPTFQKSLPWVLIAGSVVGLVSSFIITLDKIKLLENPNFKLSCNLNPIVSCGSVMASQQGSVFGFPNPWIGLAAFAALATVGVAMLAGATFKRWFWLVLEGGTVGGLGFALWLLFESVYRIRALCPYCLAVDVAVIAVFWYGTLYALQNDYIKLPKSWQKAQWFARRHHLDILILVFVLLTAAILQHFWYYYGHYFK